LTSLDSSEKGEDDKENVTAQDQAAITQTNWQHCFGYTTHDSVLKHRGRRCFFYTFPGFKEHPALAALKDQILQLNVII